MGEPEKLLHDVPFPYALRIILCCAGLFLAFIGPYELWRGVWPLNIGSAFFGMIIHHAQTKRFFNQSLGDQKSTVSNRVAAERFTDLFLAGLLNNEQATPKRK